MSTATSATDRQPGSGTAETRSLTKAEQLNRALGWFSFGLGAVETFAPQAVTKWLGMEGREGLVRAYGIREFGAGALCLSTDNEYGAASRVVGDVVDLATLADGFRNDNPKKRNVGIGLATVAAITAIDAATTWALKNDRPLNGQRRSSSRAEPVPAAA